MGKQELSKDAIALMNNMAGAMSSKKNKKKAKKSKYVIIVNGVVTPQMAKSVKAIKAAAVELTLTMLARGCKTPKIAYATISESISVSVPTATKKIDGIRGNR